MADEQENIKIVIEIVDKFSKPLVDLKKQLEQISDRGEGAKKVATNFQALRESIVGVSRTVQGLLMPSLKVLGLGFGTVATSIAAAVAALKGFAGSTVALTRLSRDTGLAVDKMRELEAVGRRVGVSANEMRAGFRNFSEEMDKMRVGVSAAATEMRQRGLGFVVDHLKSMAGDLNKQLEYSLSILDRISNPRHRREVAALLGLPRDLATLTGAERDRAIQEYRKTVGALDKDTKDAAQRFEDSMNKLADSWEKFINELAKTGTLDKLGAGMAKFADNIDPIVAKLGTAVDKLSQIADTLSNSWLFKAPPPNVSWEEWWKKQKQGGALPQLSPDVFGGPAKKMSFGATGATGETIDILKQGVSEGVQDAFKKMIFGDQADDVPGGDGGGMPRVIRASLGRSGSAGGYRGGGRAGSDGGDGADGAVDPGPMGKVTGLDRSVFAEELKQKPWLREKILGIAAGENKDPKANLAVIESMMNRAAVRGTSLEQAAKLYGKERGGYYAGYDPAALRRPKIREMIEGNLKRALEGSNVSNYATDNASSWLAEKNKRTGRFRLQQEYGGESFFSPGTAGGRSGPASRQRYEEWRRSIPVPQPRPDMAPTSDRPDVPAPAVPRERMMEASAMSNQFPRVEGNASVRIDLNGFPRGTKTSAESSGIFSEVELHRGNTLPLASESA